MDTEVTLGDIDLTTVKTRSLTGVVTLISRSVLLEFVRTGGYFFLTLFLLRPEIGLFAAVNDLVGILGYFSDIGLAASLIQKRTKVTVADLRTIFTLQQLLVTGLIVISFLLSSRIFAFYRISGPGVWLFYSLLFAFFLASLKTIPSVILERQLQFKVLAAVEVVENIIFYALAVFFASRGAGVSSYVWAVIARGLVGTALIYYLAPWPIGLSVSKTSLKSLLTFGLPYQINSLMAVVKDRFLNIALWRIIGADGVGIISWAQTWSQKPLRFIMDNVTKVTFPAMSRLQDHPAELNRAIEKTLFFITLITFPVVAGIASVTPVVVDLIPGYADKWRIALLPLALYCLNSAWASVSTPLTNTLNALGQVKTNTKLMLMWTALTWILTPLLAFRFGFMGVAWATATISFSSVIPVILVKRLTGFSLTASFAKPFLATASMLPATWLMVRVMPHSWFNLGLTIAVSGLVFVAVVFALVGQSLLLDARRFWYAFRPNK